MDKEVKKEKIEKLEKKLESRQFTLYEALQEDISVDWFKMGHPAFLAMLDSKGFAEMISYVVEIGPPDNRMRSYKVPMIAAEIMSCPMPKVFQLFFMEDEDRKGEILLAKLLNYFDGTPNYVLSGYIVKILMNLMVGNASRVLEYVFKNGKIMKMPYFMASISIADFLLRVIVVEDLLLNNKIKERIELFHKIVQIYAENREPVEILENANYFLTESIIRLWSHKHKELGRFSTEIFGVVQMIIDKNNLYHQQNLMIVIMKHLTSYADEAPFLIIALFKKIHRELTAQNTESIKLQFKETVPRFTIKKMKLLQALTSMFLNVPDIMVKQLQTYNIFVYLIDCVGKYEWNNIIQIEIEKIIKHALGPESKVEGKEGGERNAENLYEILFRQGNFMNKIKDLLKKENQKQKSGCGYSGFLLNICKYLQKIVKESTTMGQIIQKNQKEFLEITENFIKKKENLSEVADGFHVVQNVAKPRYSLATIVDEYRVFFDETETINKKYQIERPASKHIDLGEEMIHEIQNENELVYKLLTESSNEEKKSETMTESAQ